MRKVVRLLVWLLACLLSLPAVGQIPMALEAVAVSHDTLADFRTMPVPSGRIDARAGVLRAAYRIASRSAPSADPVRAARAHLEAEAASFGWPSDVRDLEVVSVEKGRFASHVTLQQIHAGVPVYGRQVKVNLDASGRPSMVLSAYAPALDAPVLSPGISRDEAAAHYPGTPPELMIYPSDPPRLVWRIAATTATTGWEVLVDAQSGEPILAVDQSTHGTALNDDGPASTPQQREISAQSTTDTRQSTIATGRGFVFDPDPLTASGNEYGGAFTDQQDADTPELNAQLVEVELPEISLGSDGLYRLEGPYVRIDGSARGQAYTPPAEPQADGFRYSRGQEHFEAVMSYFHIDRSQRYVQSLDVGREIQNGPIRVNPRGFFHDLSDYFAESNTIVFGTGGVDDAEDAQIILHEYAHALMEASAPRLLSGGLDGRALHEGWADYWAASYLRHLVDANAVPFRGWRRLYVWDGNGVGGTWCGRYIDHDGHYPERVAYKSGTGCPVSGAYEVGLLWATTMMEIYEELGKTVTDRISLASHGYLLAPATFWDAAEALIQADRDLYGGGHVGVLERRLAGRGLLESPAVANEPVPVLPGEMTLHAPFPNPSSGATTVRYTLADSGPVRLSVFDVLGRRIDVLVDEELHPGIHAAGFDASGLAAGTYLIQMETPGGRRSRPLVVAR